GYLHVKTDQPRVSNMVVPVYLEVVRGGLHPFPAKVDFGVLTDPNERRKASVALHNR
ncbi:unnamed protein product, partial [Choristocarpus tenellus]